MTRFEEEYIYDLYFEYRRLEKFYDRGVKARSNIGVTQEQGRRLFEKMAQSVSTDDKISHSKTYADIVGLDSIGLTPERIATATKTSRTHVVSSIFHHNIIERICHANE